MRKTKKKSFQRVTISRVHEILRSKWRHTKIINCIKNFYKFHNDRRSGYRDINVQLALQSGRAGSSRFTSKMDSTSKMKEYFLLMQILENSILKLLERCYFTRSDHRKSPLHQRRRLRRLFFASLAIITYKFGLKGGGAYALSPPPLIRH